MTTNTENISEEYFKEAQIINDKIVIIYDFNEARNVQLHRLLSEL